MATFCLRNTFVIVCCLAGIMLSASAQSQTETTLTPNTPINKYTMDNWTIDDGLRSNTINHVMQSNKGFIWMSTYNGLIRFDGHQFESFDKRKIGNIDVDSFYKIYESEDSTLFFITQKEGILTFKNGIFNPYEFNNNLPGSLRCLLLANDGTLWIGSADNGVFYVKDKELHKVDDDRLKGVTVLDIAEDAAGNLYFGTSGQGLVIYNGTNYKAFDKSSGLQGNVVTALGVGPDNEILVGTFQGIDVVKNGALSKFYIEFGVKTNAIHTDKFKNVWLATDKGLYKLDYQTKEMHLFGKTLRFPDSEMNAITEDYEGSLWVASEKGGLIRIKEGKFFNYTEADGLSSSKINVISQRSRDEYWIGCDNGSVHILNRPNVEVGKLNIVDKNFTNSIRDICFDSKGNAWIGSYGGIVKVTGTEQRRITTANGLYSNLVRRITEDQQGNIWIAARAGGLVKITTNGDTVKYNKENGLLTNYILSLLPQKDGSMLAGTNGGGIAKINTDGSIESYKYKANVAGVLFFNLRYDQKGRIWAATNLGLMLFENNNLRLVPVDSDRGSQSFFDAIDDKNGGFWLTCNLGLYKLKFNELEAYINKDSDELKSRLFTNHDGMRSRECTGATRSMLSDEGDIWVPTLGGVVVAESGDVTGNTLKPPVYIQSFAVDDEVYDIKEPIVVPPGHLRYKIDYTSLSYLSPGSVRFRYKLEPIDESWIGEHNFREAQYTNLSPGDYTFRVVGSNNDAVWNENGAAIKFTIKPFYYQTLWFYILMGLVVLGLFALIYFWRIKSVNKHNKMLKKLNTELDSFVYSTSHDLRAPLASMLGLINIAKLEPDHTRKNEYIGMMESSIKKLDSFIQDIIDYSRNARMPIEKEAFDLQVLIKEVFDELNFLEQSSKISKHLEVNGESQLFSDKRRLKVVLHNLVANAIKYFDPQKDPFININVFNVNGMLKIEVEDNGIGIEKEHIGSIFNMFYRATEGSSGSGIGLYIVQETMEKMGGTIKVKSTNGVGAKFTLELPL